MSNSCQNGLPKFKNPVFSRLFRLANYSHSMVDVWFCLYIGVFWHQISRYLVPIIHIFCFTATLEFKIGHGFDRFRTEVSPKFQCIPLVFLLRLVLDRSNLEYFFLNTKPLHLPYIYFFLKLHNWHSGDETLLNPYSQRLPF